MINNQPLVEEIDPGSLPVELFELFCNDSNSFFLDSAMDPEKLGRFSMMGTDPFLVFSACGEDITLKYKNRINRLKGNPFDYLGTYLETYKLDKPIPDLPCSGGAVGYLSYDLGRFIEQLPTRTVDDLQLPDSSFGFYDVMLIFDNLYKQAYILSSGFPETDTTKRLARAQNRMEEFKDRINSFKRSIPKPIKLLVNSFDETQPKSNFSRESYIQAVERARQYIINGDIYEVNLSQRYEAPISITPFELFPRQGI